ncbi:MAG: hypothetical protein BHW56_08495 [Acetobacter sp. 46_36]|nr:MAG: hypothetical protein BHW56_08495 [Acetobacter sp. 46_36]
MIKGLRRNLNYIGIFFDVLSFIAALILGQYGLNPGKFINFQFLIIVGAYTIILIWAIIKIIQVKEEQNIIEVMAERDCYKNIVIKTSDDATAKIRNKVMEAAKKLQFYSKSNKNDRITVYALLNESFFALDRFSLNPQYNKINNSKIYPFNKGCIAEGYKDGFFYESGEKFPNPINNLTEYVDYTRHKYNYTHSEVKNMSMHSVCYVVVRIHKEDKCLGVIVLESTEKNRFSQQSAKEVLLTLAKKIYPFLNILDIKAQELSRNVVIKN